MVAAMASVAPAVTSTSSSGENVEPVPGRLVGGDGGPQLGHALARRVLVAPGQHGLGRDAGQLGRPVGVGEALAQVDRVGGGGQFGHLGEDRGAVRPQSLDEIARGPDRHPGDGTGALSSGRIVLTVANFNMHCGVDGWGRRFDHVAACRELKADVIVLEEAWTPDADRAAGRGGQAEEIACRAGLRGGKVHAGRGPSGPAGPGGHRELDAPHSVSGPARTPSSSTASVRFRPPSPRRPATVEAERGSWGIAVLTRRGLLVDGTRTLHLPQLARERVRRAAVVVDLTVQGHPISVIGTHMSHLQLRVAPPLRPAAQTPARRGPSRCGSARGHEPVGSPGPGLPARVAPGGEGPDVAEPESAQPDRPHPGPRRVGIVSGQVLPDAGSDHRPVRAELTLR